MAANGTALASGEKLAAGGWLTLDEPGLNAERGTRATGEIASWRDARIVAEQDSVAALVARIARWHSGHVIIADPSLGERRISGVFDAAYPVAALEAAVMPYGAVVRQISPWLTVISPV